MHKYCIDCKHFKEKHIKNSDNTKINGIGILYEFEFMIKEPEPVSFEEALGNMKEGCVYKFKCCFYTIKDNILISFDKLIPVDKLCLGINCIAAFSSYTTLNQKEWYIQDKID